MLAWGLLLSLCAADAAVGRRIFTEPAFRLTTSPEPAVVQIGGQTFTRFDQGMTWQAALLYCRSRQTDLADLQTVIDEADKEGLKSIMSDTEAWIGLYFNAASRSLSWSSDLGASIPTWLQVPEFWPGLCAGLGTFARYSPRVYAVVCSVLKPFICFYNASIGHRESAPLPQLFYAPSEVTVGTTPSPRTSSGTAGASQRVTPEPADLGADTSAPGASAGPREGPLTPLVTAKSASSGPSPPASPPAPAPSPISPTPPGNLSVPQKVTGTALASASSPAAVPAPPEHPVSPAPPASPPPPRPSPTGPTPPGKLSVPQKVTGTPLAFASSPAAVSEPPEHPVTEGRPGTPREATAGPSLGSTGGASATSRVAAPPGSATSSRCRGFETPGSAPGTEESTSGPSGPGSPTAPQSTTARPQWAARSPAARPETAGSRSGPETAVTSEGSGTDMRDVATATQAQQWSSSNHPDSKEKTPAPESGQRFGILKADFTIPALMDPEDMKDQFLSEIQEVLQFTLGHEKFRLKWISFEVNKK